MYTHWLRCFWAKIDIIPIGRMWVSILAVAALISAGCSKKTINQDEYITIGAVSFITSDNIEEGALTLASLQLAMMEINDRMGGVLGKKIDIIALNGKGDPEHALKQYEALKNMGAVAILGSTNAGVAKALMIASERDGMPYVALSGFLTDVEDRDTAYLDREYSVRYRMPPPRVAISAYISVHVLTEAIHRAGNTNKNDIISELKIGTVGQVLTQFELPTSGRVK
ncbi:MAG: ABC transporter substrate-binding protein [Holophagaceae bacterium]|jgi:ABC-type branched-subunit amino acid transport system substrate-binding protein|nr:ABC transporter substrate-binding protein [Holophagaceae bacterium]